MDLLKQRILKDGKIISDSALSIDSFLNHQIDARLMLAIGEEFARRFMDQNITKIITIESSGIAPAIFTGLCLNIPVVFAKKKKPLTMDGAYTAEVFSFTKQETATLSISKEYLQANDRILIIDDFLASGSATKALMKIIDEAKAQLCAVGIVVEKGFQDGGKFLRSHNIKLESLAILKSLQDGTIVFEQNS